MSNTPKRLPRLKRRLKTLVVLTKITALGMGCAHTLPTSNLGQTVLESKSETFPASAPIPISVPVQEKKFFKSMKQLTFGGINTTARWSFDGEWLAFQHRGPGLGNKSFNCDQIFKIKIDGTQTAQLSSGLGKAISPSFTPQNNRILLSSTSGSNAECPSENLNIQDFPSSSSSVSTRSAIQKKHYRFLSQNYLIYGIKPDGSDPIYLEPGAPRAYQAETAVCQDGSVVFTSDRDKSLNLYSAKLDSLASFQEIKRLTSSNTRYDSHAQFSPDCKKIVWRATQPRSEKEIRLHQTLFADHWVQDSQSEIWVANQDGSDPHAITHLRAMSFAPVFTPDGQKILFSSNWPNPNAKIFSLFLIRLDGTHLEKVTFSNSFDGFATFSLNGKNLIFSSKRNSKNPSEYNLFVARWRDK